MGDMIARAIAAQNAKRTGPFAYNTDIGLRRWRAALAKLKAGASNIVNVSVLGDSITEGTGSTDYLTKGYVGRIRAALATKFGDVGTGFISTFYPFSVPLWTFTGTGWSDVTGQFGTAGKYKKSVTNGDSATLSFNGTGIVVVVQRGNAGGTFTVSIDGAAATTFNTAIAGTTDVYGFQLTGLVAGNHTMTLTSTVTGGANLFLLGAYPLKGTAGVRVNMVGRYGSLAVNSASNEGLDAEITTWSPALTIVAFMANDSSTGTALDTYRANLQTIITRALAYGDCLLLSTGARTDAAASLQASYVQVMKDLAISNGVAFIDLFARWNSDGNYANTTLGLLSDSVHPNDYGHHDIATAVLNVLLEDR